MPVRMAVILVAFLSMGCRHGTSVAPCCPRFGNSVANDVVPMSPGSQPYFSNPTPLPPASSAEPAPRTDLQSKDTRRQIVNQIFEVEQGQSEQSTITR